MERVPTAGPDEMSISNQNGQNDITDSVTDQGQREDDATLAECLTGLLWGEDRIIASMIAWRIGHLVSNPQVEETLREYPLEDKHRQSERLAGVWNCFADPSQSTIRLIMERVACLLLSSEGDYPSGVGTLDVRMLYVLISRDERWQKNEITIPAAELLHEKGFGKLAEDLFRKVLDSQVEEFGEEHEVTVRGMEGLGKILVERKAYPEAEQLFRKIAKAQEHLPGDHRFVLSETLSQLGRLSTLQGRHKDSVGFYERCLELRQSLLDPSDPWMGMAHYNLGMSFNVVNDRREAEFHMREAEAILKQYDHQAQNWAAAVGGLGRILHDKGETQEAEELYRKSLEQRKKELGMDHRDVAVVEKNLGSLLREGGELAKAREHLQRAHKLFIAHNDDLFQALTRVEIEILNHSEGIEVDVPRLEEAVSFLEASIFPGMAKKGKKLIETLKRETS